MNSKHTNLKVGIVMIIVPRIKYLYKCRLAALDRSMAGYNAMTCSVGLQGCGIKIFLWGAV